MKVVCSCGQEIGEKEPMEDKRISHAYCTKCAYEILAKLRKANKKAFQEK